MQRICQKTLKDTMYFGDILVLTYKINYPCFTTTCCAASSLSINDYYYQDAERREKYCRTVLYSQALKNAEDAKDRPFYNYEYSFDFTITYNAGCITSLYMDTYTFIGGAHGNTIRTSNTWNFRTETLLQLSDVYPLTPSSLSKLQNCIEFQIEERLKEYPGIYFDEYEFLLRDYFSIDNFYLQPCNVVIYYQHYDISPYYVGIPEFCLPIKNIC